MAEQKPGFWQRAKDAVNYVWNAENYQYTPLLATGPGFFVQSGSINWNVNYLKDGYLDNEIIYQALRVYLKKAKVAPITLSKVVDEKALAKYQSFVASAKNQEHRVTALVERKKALNEIDSHSLLDLINNPNSYQTGTELREALYGYWKLTGDGYLYGAGAPGLGVNAGKYTELHVLESQYCTPVYSNNWRDPISHYEYNIDGEVLKLSKENICHLKDWNPSSKINGLSPVVPGAKVIKTDSYNKTAQARAFENGGKGYMLSSDSDDPDAGYTEAQAKLVDEKIRQKLQGAHNNGNIFSITRKTKVQAIGDSAADMKLIEAAKYARPVISQLFGVDGILIGDKEGGTENNVAAAYKALVTNTTVPDLIEVREHLQKFLTAPYKGQNLYIDFDTTIYPELQPDLSLLVTVYGKPSITEDERRALFNYDKLDDAKLGSAILIPSGMETLESIVNMVTDNTNEADQMIEEAAKRYSL